MDKKILATQKDVYDALAELQIAFKPYEHPASKTIEDLCTHIGKMEHAPFVKNLVYIDKKKSIYFIVAHGDTQVGAGLWKRLGTAKSSVRMVDEALLKEVLNTTRGAVGIFALVNDSERRVKRVVVDKRLEGLSHWTFPPQVNTCMIELTSADAMRFLRENSIEFEFMDLECNEEVSAPVETKQGIEHKKAENFGEWYSQVITRSDLIEYYDISGCYILRPSSFFIWETLQGALDAEFKRLGVSNSYFPMFVLGTHLKKEEENFAGFQAEVAWVTHSGESKLQEPIAIRPTSETIMYPYFAKWIKSHRDLPLKLNQWTNVVRWEFKHPTPFIRTREFLWQEGHTAHATRTEADEMVFNILDVYAAVYRDFLAVPVVKGVKSEHEKFGGALFSSTCETFVAENGRAIQACTSHNLGQNFARVFDVRFEDENQEMREAWQTSWGFTTRSIGIAIMLHSDDRGLVLPPRVARLQVVVIPVYYKSADNDALRAKAEEVVSQLRAAGLRAEADLTEQHNVGWKFSEWEMKGVPLRVEVGPKDLEAGEVRFAARFDAVRRQVALGEVVVEARRELDRIHEEMYAVAKRKMDEKTFSAGNWSEFMAALNKAGVVRTPWCQKMECEEQVKVRSAQESKLSAAEAVMSGAAKTLCIPLEQEPLHEASCFHCGSPAEKWVLWGRSY